MKTRMKGFKSKTLSPLSEDRFKIVFLLLCLGLGGLFFRVGWLQVFQSDQLTNKAREVQTEKKKPLGTRRSILDRNGKLVAIDDGVAKVYSLELNNIPAYSPTQLQEALDLVFYGQDLFAIRRLLNNYR